MTKINFKYLKLENFRIHNEFEIDLSKNKLLLVVGKNGSGKTSIIDGIFWCLYDETVKGQKGDSVVNYKVGKNCSAILKFDIDGTEYEIQNYRKHSKFKNTKILIRDGKQISTNMDVKETNDIISNIIMPKDLFSNCMLFSNYMKEPFLSRTHSGQKEILDKMLSLEKYDEYYEKVSNDINLSNSDLEQLELNNKSKLDKLNYIENNLNNEKESYENTIQNYNDKIENDKLEIKEKEKELKSLEKDIKKYEDIQNEIDKYKEQFLNIKNLLQKLNNDTSNEKSNIEIKYKDKFNEGKLNLNNKVSSKKNELNEYKTTTNNIYNDTINTQNEQISKTNNQINEIRLNKNKIENELNFKLNKKLNESESKYKTENDKFESLSQSKNNDIIKLKNEINHIENLLDEKTNEIDNLNNSKTCSVCQRPFDENTKDAIQKKINSLNEYINEQKQLKNDKNKQIQSYLDEIKKIQSNQNKLKEKYNDHIEKVKDEYHSDIKTEMNKLEIVENEKIEELKLYETQLSDIKTKLNSEISKITNQINELDSKIESKLEEFRQNLLNQKETELEKLKEKYIEEKTQLDLRYNLLKERIEKEEEKLNDLNDKKDYFDNLKNDIIKLNNTIEMSDKYKNEITEKFNKNKKSLENDIKIINKDLKEFETNKNNILEKIDILKFWKKAFSDIGIKSILLDESIPILNKRARELSKLTEKIRVSFSSQTTLKSGKNNNKFNIDAVHSEHLSEYADFSAGETKLVNIIVLLSLRYLLENMSGKKINLLLLDEILDSLDEDNSSMVAKILEDLSKEYLIMLITHTQKEWIQYNEELRF